MKCPACGESDLTVQDRQGVEIDVCTRCRGVWLDRGELDKIIDRYAAYDDGHHKDVEEDRHNRDPYHGGGRRRSFWREIFD